MRWPKPVVLPAGGERLGDVDCGKRASGFRLLDYDTAASDSSHSRLAFSGSSA